MSNVGLDSQVLTRSPEMLDATGVMVVRGPAAGQSTKRGSQDRMSGFVHSVAETNKGKGQNHSREYSRGEGRARAIE